jgi:putative holliday junction resolvase
MGRILGLDFGTKRTGIAGTDPLQIVVSPLGTFPTPDVIGFLKEYTMQTKVDRLVCGHPGTEDSKTLHALDGFIKKLKAEIPALEVVFQDEQYTSQRASAIILRSGVPKMKRRNRALIDQVAAVLILQEYLGHLN